MAHVNPTFLSTYPLSNTEGNLQIKSCFQELWRTAPWTEKKKPVRLRSLRNDSIKTSYFHCSCLKHFKQIVVDNDNLSQLLQLCVADSVFAKASYWPGRAVDHSQQFKLWHVVVAWEFCHILHSSSNRASEKCPFNLEVLLYTLKGARTMILSSVSSTFFLVFEGDIRPKPCSKAMTMTLTFTCVWRPWPNSLYWAP